MEFDSLFKDEDSCLDYLEKLRWPSGYACPNCNSDKFWVISRGLRMCKHCGRQTSLTSGTIFHRSKKPLLTWFKAMWWIVAQKNGVSALGLQKIMGFGSYRTAWTWLHKFRRVMVVPGREQLSGVVEIDETLVGGKKTGKRGRGAQGKVLVVIAVETGENGTGRARLGIVPDATASSLEAFIVANVDVGSHIITDGWAGYGRIRNLGYEHEIEDKTVIFEGQEVLPNVHRIASLLKRWLLGTHQGGISIQQLEYYLDEFTFRHNRRSSKSRGLLFQRLLEQAVGQGPIKYKDITKHHI